MIRACWCKAFVQASSVKVMSLIGQKLAQRPPYHHDTLMRPIGFIAGKEIDIGAHITDIRQTMWRITDPINADKSPCSMRQRGNFSDRIDLSDHI